MVHSCVKFSLPPILHPKVLVGFLNIQSEEQVALLCQTKEKEVVRTLTFRNKAILQ